ncbi:PREDICTED: uncharacterized protein LOC106807921 [Priapulus caudatus]|uniref:Uncharacterized protein LOC106807921 n=1 Tax=Priapulus caudatus TaxID=37621 RepID=A0ABM1E150_PRICU|nr:PREDICTED: uncharacterized protein LOC106807921 [Priapulus caudatus]
MSFLCSAYFGKKRAKLVRKVGTSAPKKKGSVVPNPYSTQGDTYDSASRGRKPKRDEIYGFSPGKRSEASRRARSLESLHTDRKQKLPRPGPAFSTSQLHSVTFAERAIDVWPDAATVAPPATRDQHGGVWDGHVEKRALPSSGLPADVSVQTVDRGLSPIHWSDEEDKENTVLTLKKLAKMMLTTRMTTRCGLAREIQVYLRLSQYTYPLTSSEAIEEVLDLCTRVKPANVPLLVMQPYQPSPHWSAADEVEVDEGMVVNALYKHRQWVYVRTPENREGFVPYTHVIALSLVMGREQNTVEQCLSRGGVLRASQFQRCRRNYHRMRAAKIDTIHEQEVCSDPTGGATVLSTSTPYPTGIAAPRIGGNMEAFPPQTHPPQSCYRLPSRDYEEHVYPAVECCGYGSPAQQQYQTARPPPRYHHGSSQPPPPYAHAPSLTPRCVLSTRSASCLDPPPPRSAEMRRAYSDWSYVSDAWDTSRGATSLLYVDPDNLMHDGRPPKPPRVVVGADEPWRPTADDWRSPRHHASLPRYMSAESVCRRGDVRSHHQRSPSVHDLILHRFGPEIEQQMALRYHGDQPADCAPPPPSVRYVGEHAAMYVRRTASCNRSFAPLPEEQSATRPDDGGATSHPKQSSQTSDLGESIEDRPAMVASPRYVAADRAGSVATQQRSVRCGVNSLPRHDATARLPASVSLQQLPRATTTTTEEEFEFKRPRTPERFRGSGGGGGATDIRRTVSFQEPLNKLSPPDGATMSDRPLPTPPSPKWSPTSDGVTDEYGVQDIADVLSNGNASQQRISLPYSPAQDVGATVPVGRRGVPAGATSPDSSPFNSSTSTVLDRRESAGEIGGSGGSSGSWKSGGSGASRKSAGSGASRSSGSGGKCGNGSAGGSVTKGKSPRRMLTYDDRELSCKALPSAVSTQTHASPARTAHAQSESKTRASSSSFSSSNNTSNTSTPSKISTVPQTPTKLPSDPRTPTKIARTPPKTSNEYSIVKSTPRTPPIGSMKPYTPSTASVKPSADVTTKVASPRRTPLKGPSHVGDYVTTTMPNGILKHRVAQPTSSSPGKPTAQQSSTPASPYAGASPARSLTQGGARKLNNSDGSDSFRSSSSDSFASSPGVDSPNESGSGSGFDSGSSSSRVVIGAFTRIVDGPLATLLYDFQAMEEDDLTARRGDVVRLVNADDQQWLWVALVSGERVGAEGFIPASYALLNDKQAGDSCQKSLQQVKTYL